MATVLMTGAHGLIGSHVAARWDRAAGTLLCVGRSDVDLLAPGAFKSIIERTAPDVVLHLAWCAGGVRTYRSSPENQVWADVSHEVATLCARNEIAFVVTGTVLDDRDDATDAYASSKRMLRHALTPEIEAGAVTWARPFYVFDPERDRPEVLRVAHEADAAGRSAALKSPRAAHDFIHVMDVARGLLAVVEHRLTHVVDIGSGRLHTVSELVEGAGYVWHEEPGGQTLHDDRIADIDTLRAIGWAPIDTERFFGHG